MIYIKLIIDFFIVGLLSFGGSYAAIPLIRDVASHYDVISEEMLIDFIAISESTPGPIAVNFATFVGARAAGVPGAVIATIVQIIPAFVIILLFTIIFSKFIQSKNVSYALSIIRPCIIGIIMAVGIHMFMVVFGTAINAAVGSSFNGILKTILIAVFIVLAIQIYKKITSKKLSAIKIIIIGAFLGIALNYFL